MLFTDYSTLQVFINPAVASLPEHAHLLSEHGCYKSKTQNRPCGTGMKKHIDTESKLPDSFLPLKITPDMDFAWEKLVFGKTMKDVYTNNTAAISR
jgi:hypothetical protein